MAPMDRSFARSRLGFLADAALALVLFGLAMATVRSGELFGGETYSRPHDGWQVVLIAVQTLPLAVRRVWPVPVLAVICLGWGIDRSFDYPASQAVLALPVAFHAVGSELDGRRALQIGGPIAGFLVMFTVLGAVEYESVSVADVAMMGLITFLPLALGREVSDRRTRTAQLERHTRDLERRQHEQARDAVREERSRIARELHDVVAHEMTVMTVQAAAARRLVDRDPDQAREALSAVEAAGHEALDEMRRLLGVLRTKATAEDTDPQPGLHRLPELTAQMVEAGLPVEVTVEGPPRDLPVGVDLNVYRIIQESLTNTLKHGGPGVRAWVRIIWANDLTVEISDDGRGGAGDAPGSQSTGHGHLGMRERVALLGGELRTGPRFGGGYRVWMNIPLETK